jgi:hypothetical protein
MNDNSVQQLTLLFTLLLLFMSTGWDYVSELRPLTGLLFIPQVIYEYGATVEWYWQEKLKELWQKPVPVLLCPPRIPHALTRARTRASAVRRRRLIAWAWHGLLFTLIDFTGCFKQWPKVAFFLQAYYSFWITDGFLLALCIQIFCYKSVSLYTFSYFKGLR